MVGLEGDEVVRLRWMVASPSPGRRVELSTRCWTCRTGGLHVRNRTTRLSNSAMLGWTRLCENTKSFVCQVMCVRLCFLPLSRFSSLNPIGIWSAQISLPPAAEDHVLGRFTTAGTASAAC
jgi:hypothetical protein